MLNKHPSFPVTGMDTKAAESLLVVIACAAQCLRPTRHSLHIKAVARGEGGERGGSQEHQGVARTEEGHAVVEAGTQGTEAWESKGLRLGAMGNQGAPAGRRTATIGSHERSRAPQWQENRQHREP